MTGLPAYLRNLKSSSSSLKLIGLRDHFDEAQPLLDSDDALAPLLRWVPCASAMHMAFNKYSNSSGLIPVKSKRKIGYLRPQDPIARKGCEGSTGTGVGDGEKIPNWKFFPDWLASGLVTAADVAPDHMMIDDTLKFLSESDVVVANTYHAVYWATLLGKKVVLCDPWSTQFDRLKWPVTRYTGDLAADAGTAVSYPEAMQEAKDANLAFASEVRVQLGLPGTLIPRVETAAKALFRASDMAAIQSYRTVSVVAIGIVLAIVCLLKKDAIGNVARKRSGDIMAAAREARKKLSSTFSPGEKMSMSSGGPASEEGVSHRLKPSPSGPGPSLLAPRLGAPDGH